MKPSTLSRFSLLSLAGVVLFVGGATSAQARDRIRIPLPPPPHEVIQDVRSMIHRVGRDIKKAAQDAVAPWREPDEPEYQPKYRKSPPKYYDYPEGMDSPEEREFYRRDYDLRRQEQFRRDQEERRNERIYREDARERIEREDNAMRPAPDDRLGPVPNLKKSDGSNRALPPKTSKDGSAEKFQAPSPGLSPNSEITRRAATPPTTTTKKTEPSEIRYGTPVTGKKGLVYPPDVEKTPENMVDVSDFTPGQLVRNPRTGELFRVP